MFQYNYTGRDRWARSVGRDRCGERSPNCRRFGRQPPTVLPEQLTDGLWGLRVEMLLVLSGQPLVDTGNRGGGSTLDT
jgi:hypothetical protein